MQFVRIWLLSIAAAIVYGIVHDQVTAHYCVEYFTIGHPPVFHTHSPALLAFGWGVIATWWMGAFLGFFVGVAATFGKYPELRISQLLKAMAALLLIMALCASVSGVGAYLAARAGRITVFDFGGLLSPATALRFTADYWAHSASYAAGFFGGIGLCVWIFWRRRRLQLALQFEK